MKKRILYIVLFFTLLMGASCTKDFEELNKNPYYSTVTSVGPLFNNVVSSLQLGWNEQFYIHNEVLYKETQLAALSREAWGNLSLGTEEVWAQYYKALAHIRDIDRRFEAIQNTQSPDSLNNALGMVKIITAYKTFRVTDLFGDIPFFNAGRGFEGVEYLHPAYDSQEEIYLYLLEELKWAAENMNTTGINSNGNVMYSLAEYDKLFNGDIQLWIKFANSLRLRYALRMAEAEPQKAGEIISDIITNNLPVIESGEDVMMMPSDQGWVKESTNWSFREHKNLRMGTNIWKQLSENDSLDGSGIFDPRAYIFFETNNENQWIAFPQNPESTTEPTGGMPYQPHRDINYTIKGNDCIYSPFNYYVIRDQYDIPEIILTAAENYFIKAEAYMRGIGLEQNSDLASGAFFEGVIASTDFWGNLKDGSAMWMYTAPGYETANPYDVANKIFFTEDKLSLILAQRWLDLFRQPWEAYSLSRRTEATPREGDALNHFRLPYPPSESEHNTENWSQQVSNMGGDLTTIKVWWNK